MLGNANKLIFCGFLDLFSVSIFITSLPSFVKSFDVSTTYIGCFFSLYGALQILSSYMMGYLADKSDQKSVLCFCTALSAIGYFCLGLAPSFTWLFFLRLITGLSKQTQTLSRTILSTMSASRDMKIKNLGRFSTFSSIGFIFGPPIGGYVHENYGFFYVGCLTSLGFFLMLLIFWSLDNETDGPSLLRSNNLEIPSKPTVGEGVRRRKNVENIVKESESVATKDDDTLSLVIRTWDILGSIFLLSFCPLIFRINYSLTLKERFQSSGTMSGFVTSFGAVTGSVAGLLAPYIINLYHSYYHDYGGAKVKKVGETSSTYPETMLLFHTSLILSFSILGCGLASSMFFFILCQFPVSFVNNISREGFNVIISKRVLKNQIGRVMGMNGSLVAFGRLVAPVIGGFLQEYSYQFPAYCGSMCSFLAAAIIYMFFFRDRYRDS